jgi:hypothetical protein
MIGRIVDEPFELGPYTFMYDDTFFPTVAVKINGGYVDVLWFEEDGWNANPVYPKLEDLEVVGRDDITRIYYKDGNIVFVTKSEPVSPNARLKYKTLTDVTLSEWGSTSSYVLYGQKHLPLYWRTADLEILADAYSWLISVLSDSPKKPPVIDGSPTNFMNKRYRKALIFRDLRIAELEPTKYGFGHRLEVFYKEGGEMHRKFIKALDTISEYNDYYSVDQ